MQLQFASMHAIRTSSCTSGNSTSLVTAQNVPPLSITVVWCRQHYYQACNIAPELGHVENALLWQVCRANKVAAQISHYRSALGNQMLFTTVLKPVLQLALDRSDLLMLQVTAWPPQVTMARSSSGDQQSWRRHPVLYLQQQLHQQRQPLRHHQQLQSQELQQRLLVLRHQA